MKNEKFKKALPILEKITQHQHDAFFVGGCVRDYILNRPIKDVDITTSAKPEEIQQIFTKVIPVGIEHGTVIVRHEGESYEVTTFRLDGEYTDGRHPDDVVFIDQIDKDLERRDFTINALAMDMNGNIIDLFEGQEDMKKRHIRTVGNGYERFKEDALRIIRALRFSSQLGFDIYSETIEQMIYYKQDIAFLSVERITNEMERFFSGVDIEKGLTYLLQTKIYEELPIFKDYPELIYKLPKRIKPLSSFATVITLFHHLDQNIPISDWVKAWKCSNQTKNMAEHLHLQLCHYEKHGLNKKLAFTLKEEAYEAFITLVEILKETNISKTELEQWKNKLPIQSRKELAINGNDLLQLFPNRKPGPWIKEELDLIENQIINGCLSNNISDIKEWLRCSQREIN